MPELRARRWSIALALGAACSRAPAPTSEPTTPPAPVDAPAEPEAAVEPTHPLELLPTRARMMLMVRSPTRLAEAWDRARLAAEYPQIYETLVLGMKHQLGRDLLDPAQLAEIGIDPSAPAGVAVLSLRDEAVVLFGACSDPERLAQTVDAALGHPAPRRTVGTAELLTLDQDVTLVLRHGLFALVGVGRHRPGRFDYVSEVARLDPSRSLAHGSVLHQALAGLPDDADLHGLLDVAGLLFDELDAERRSDEEGLAQAQRRLAEAAQRGASGPEIEALQRDLAGEQDFVARRRRERQMSQRLVARTLGSIEGFGLAAYADDRGLRGRVHMALASDSVFRRLLRSHDQAPPAVLALDHEPQLVLAGQLDVGTAVELMSELAQALGASYGELDEAARRELRIELDREILPQLDGQLALVLAANVPDGATSVGPLDELLGGAWSVGVRDPIAARARLDDAVRAWPELAWSEAPEVGGHGLSHPEAPHELWLGVVADQLVVSPDPALLRRVHDGTAGAAASRLPDTEAWAMLTEGPAVARLALHHRLPVMLGMAVGEAFDSFPVPSNVDMELRGELGLDELVEVPRGKAVRALDRRLEGALQRTRELRQQLRDERRARAWRIAGALGITVGAVRPVDTGFMIEGGHYVTGGLGRYVETLWQLLEAGHRPSELDAKLERASQEVEQIHQRLLDARRRELTRALAAPGR